MTGFGDVQELIALDLRSMASVFADGRPPEAGPDLNWLAVLSLFSIKCSDAEAGFIADRWDLLRRAYDCILVEAVRDEAINQREQAIRAVTFRSFLMMNGATGSSVDHLYRESVAIIVKELPMPLERARRETVDWRTQPIDTIRDLRYIKQLLRPMAELLGHGLPLAEDPTIALWLESRLALP